MTGTPPTLDVQARLPLLSTYLGHVEPASTYYYLTAAPELLALAARRLEPTTEGLCMTTLAPTLEAYFTDRLLCQQRVSPNTIASYRDAFRLLLAFVQQSDRHPAIAAGDHRPRRADDRRVPRASRARARQQPPAPATSASPRSTRSFSTARCGTPSTPP